MACARFKQGRGLLPNLECSLIIDVYEGQCLASLGFSSGGGTANFLFEASLEALTHFIHVI